MSKFLEQLQSRLQARLKSKQQNPPEPAGGALAHRSTESLASNITHSPEFGILTGMASPTAVARLLSYLGMALTVLAITYWVMQLILIPSIPEIQSSANNKSNPGMTLYANQDSTAAYDLFGSKPVMTDAIYLRGVVATGKNPNGSIDGFAIFEIDGKPGNAISVGESLGKGLTLFAIGDESATLLYQGQKLEFKLSKPSSPNPKAPKKK